MTMDGGLWYVCDEGLKAMIKTIPKKKKRKMAKWLSNEALQIAEKRREAKDRIEKERYIIWMHGSKEQQE